MRATNASSHAARTVTLALIAGALLAATWNVSEAASPRCRSHARACVRGYVQAALECAATAADDGTLVSASCVDKARRAAGACLESPRLARLSSCLGVTLIDDASGTADACGGTMRVHLPLAAEVTITGNAEAPCPLCEEGRCSAAAANPGAACVDAGRGLNRECVPLGVTLPLPVLADMTAITGSATLHADGQGGFCPGQASAGALGDAAAAVTLRGRAAGPLLPGEHPSTLVAGFCIPASGNDLLDLSAALPGPSIATFPVRVELAP